MNLDMSRKNITFATTKGAKDKSNNSNNNNIILNIKYNINNKYNNMEVIYSAIETTLNSFDFAYCLVVNILTYIIINIINSINKNIDIGTWNKRIILLLCIILIGSIYYFIGSDIKLIINSSILAPVFWSWVIKPICKHFKIDYKQFSAIE